MRFPLAPSNAGQSEPSPPNQMAMALRNLQRAVEQCSDAVFITDPAGVITRVNPAFERLTGHASENAIGTDLSCMIAGGAQSDAYRCIWAHIFADNVFRGAVEFQRKGGGACNLQVAITPLRDRKGMITNLVGTGQELSIGDDQPMGLRPEIAHDLGNVLTILEANAQLALDSVPRDHPAWKKLQKLKDASRSAAELMYALLHPSETPRASSYGSGLANACADTTGMSPNSSAVTDTPQPLSIAPADPTPTLLVVDDDALIREATADFLAKSGYKVLSAASAEEALKALESHAGVQLAITDVVLPQMSGPQLADALAAIAPDIKVLLISGYSEAVVVKRGNPAAQLHFLQKPFSSHMLGVKVQEILGQNRQARGAAGAAG